MSSVVKRFPPLGGIPKASPSQVQKQETGIKTLEQISVRDHVSEETAKIAERKKRKAFLSFNFFFFFKQKLPRDTGLGSQVF